MTEYISPQFLFSMDVIVFATVIFMHLSKKNSHFIFLYAGQSLAVILLLLLSSFEKISLSLLLVAALIFVVKVVVAPYFFLRFTKMYKLRFASNTYLSVPMTLLSLTIITSVAFSQFAPFISIEPSNGNALLISIAAMLASLFLVINQKGAIPQVIGILSLENGIVSFASAAGLEQSPTLQIGIVFDILVWIILAAIFISMLYKQFGSLDVTTMKHLKE
jgi:hydrogenase-4 component E